MNDISAEMLRCKAAVWRADGTSGGSGIRKRDLCRSLSLILNEGGDSEWLFLYLLYTIQAKCETNLYVT